jgi:hypothetical protein
MVAQLQQRFETNENELPLYALGCSEAEFRRLEHQVVLLGDPIEAARS